MDGRTAVADVCIAAMYCVHRCNGQPGNVVCAMQCVHLCICNDHQCEVLHYNKHFLCVVKNSEDGQMCVLQHCNQLQVPANFVLFCKPQNISPLKECKSMKCIDRSKLELRGVRSGQFTNVLCHGQGWLRVSLPECCARRAFLTMDVFIFTLSPICLIQSMAALYIPLVTKWVTYTVSHWYFWICKGRSFQGTFS